MSSFEKVMKIIDESDLVLEVLDARFPSQTRNQQLEKIVSAKGKQLVLVLNKSDLISKNKAGKFKEELEKEFPTVFISSTGRSGSSRLREAIGGISKGNKARVGVIGYPNTGKSSLINLLKGKKSAKTSITAGFTKGKQLVKVSEDIYLIDSPGVIPAEEKDEFKLVLIASRNPDQISDPEGVAEQLIELISKEKPDAIERIYGVKPRETPEETLQEIALTKKRLKKGGVPDTEVIARQILLDWQKGKIKIF